MTWPWVSRRAYDEVVSQRDALRGEVSELLAHVTRMDRVEHGRPEVPKDPKPRVILSEEIRTAISRYDSGSTQRLVEEDVRRALEDGTPEPVVLSQLQAHIPT